MKTKQLLLTFIKKIWIFILLFWSFCASAQFEHYLNPLSSRLFINPSYTGFQQKRNFWTGTRYTSETGKQVWKQFSMSADGYNEKHKIGLGIIYNQGFAGKVNISVSELGIIFSKPIEIERFAVITPSLNANMMLGYKQLYTVFVDRAIDDRINPPVLPGGENLRFTGIKPKVGFLFEKNRIEMGLVFQTVLYRNFVEYSTPFEKDIEKNNLKILFHISGKKIIFRNGLLTKPVKIVPELIISYANHSLIQQVSLKRELTKLSYGAFYYQDIMNNICRFGSIAAYHKGYLKLNLGAGISLPVISSQFSFNSEVSLSITLPEPTENKKNPWKAKKIQL